MIDLEKYKRIMARNEYSKLGYTLSDSTIAELIQCIEEAKEIIGMYASNQKMIGYKSSKDQDWIEKYFPERKP